MTLRAFVPTHRLTRSILYAPIALDVMLDADLTGDGPAYTHVEFLAYTTPRFAVVDGAWHLDGLPCTGLLVEPLTDHTTPETTAQIALPDTPEWRSHEYPETVRLRRDGSVVVRGLFGARAYRTVAHFCRAWRALVTFTVTPAMGPRVGALLPDELIVRYTGEVYALYSHDEPDRRFSSLLLACQALNLDSDVLYRGSVRATEDYASFRSVASSFIEHDHLLWELASVWTHAPPTGHVDMAAPSAIVPLRGRVDAAKVRTLAAEMSLEGWDGPPLLVERMPYGGYVAWTGRHRILAARQVGLPTVPIVTVDPIAWARVHGTPCPYGAVYDTRDDLHRAVSLAMCGDLVAASVMAHELSKVPR